MNRNTGIFGTIALALAAVGLFFMPSGKGEPATTGSAQTGSPMDNGPAAPQPAQQELLAPCREIRERISEFNSAGSVTPPPSCFENPSNTVKLPDAHFPPAPELHFIIATLPDPVHTHFSLLFDRLAEALQQAAQDQGYNYDGSWLPWNNESRSYGSLKDQQNADELLAAQEKQPGVLVFRKALPPSDSKPRQPAQNAGQPLPPCSDQGAPVPPYCEGLIVFVVGENPTGGINLSQFHNAVEWIQAVQAASQPPAKEGIRILGPYFSGSFPSLARALRPSLGETNKTITIFSGTVSSKLGIEWFTKFLGDSHDHTFYSFQENDDLMIDRYCQYLTKLGYDTGKLAILSEDETSSALAIRTITTTNG